MIVGNVVAFWIVIVSQGDFSSYLPLLNSISIKDGTIALVVPIVAFVLDGVLSSDAKARFVYWNYRHPLPASRAFNVHLPKEVRANPNQLAKSWGPFPSDPDEQNRLWYQIYTSMRQEARVREAHRSWLFARDLSAYSFQFLVIFGIGALASDAILSTVSRYLLGIFVQYVATMIAARNYGNRFVRTVLSVASQ